MQFLGQYWGSYLKLGFILAIPILVFYGMATFYFIQSALGQDSFEAYAAPAIPSPKVETVAEENLADEEPLSELVVECPDSMKLRASTTIKVSGGVPPYSVKYSEYLETEDLEKMLMSDGNLEQQTIEDLNSGIFKYDANNGIISSVVFEAEDSSGNKGTCTTSVESIYTTGGQKTTQDAQPSLWGNPKGVGPSVFATDKGSDSESMASMEDLIKKQNSRVMTTYLLSFIFILLIALYQLIAILAFARLTVVIGKGEYSGEWSVIKWSIGKMGTYIALLIRILFYSFVWVPLLVLVVYTVINFLTMMGSELIPMNSIVLINYILGAVGLISPIIVIIRMPRTLFANFVLADRECSSKEALGHSVEISIGHWWRIVLYLLGIGLLTGVVSGVLSTVIGKISVLAGGLVSIVLSVLIAFYMIIFNFGLYRMLGALFANRQQ